MSQSILLARRRREASVQQVAPEQWRLPVMLEADAELWVVAGKRGWGGAATVPLLTIRVFVCVLSRCLPAADAAQGIGLELTKQLLQRGRLVIAVRRCMKLYG